MNMTKLLYFFVLFVATFPSMWYVFTTSCEYICCDGYAEASIVNDGRELWSTLSDMGYPGYG